MIPLRIGATGMYAPEKIQTNAELSPLVRKSPEWIGSRTGVERRRLADGLDHAELGARAARMALGDGPRPDLVINASGSTRQVLPDLSCFIVRELGLDGVSSFTVHSSCLSFVTALPIAASLLQTGLHKRILVVSAEIATTSRNLEEAESAVLLGDGAAAAVVEADPSGESGILAQLHHTWPEGAGLTEVRGGGTRRHPNESGTERQDNLFHMDGPRIYRQAKRRIEELLDEMFATSPVRREDVDWVVPHQASRLAIAGLPGVGFPEHKAIDILADYGNCVAASIPMALHTAVSDGRIRRGQTVLLIGTGAGLGIGAVLLRY